MRKIKNSELNRLSVEGFKIAKKLPVLIVLEDIRSLNNIGSIFRTADSFRVEGIHLCGITASPPHREINKTALGATESVEWKYFESVDDSLSELKSKGYSVIAVEQVEESIMLNDYQPNQIQKTVLIFGNEINGVSLDALKYADFCLEIPQFGTKHSFNVSVSAGIVLWHLYQEFSKI
ncbi:MAG: RNA methyltransferase [Bacteroidales bacterium]